MARIGEGWLRVARGGEDWRGVVKGSEGWRGVVKRSEGWQRMARSFDLCLLAFFITLHMSYVCPTYVLLMSYAHPVILPLSSMSVVSVDGALSYG